MKKFIFGSLFSILFLTILVGCSSSGETDKSDGSKGTDKAEGETYKIRLSIVGPEDHSSAVAFREVEEEIKEMSGGRIEIDLFPNGQLYGSEREAIEAVQLGNIEMTVTTTAALSGFSPNYMVFDLPFLYDDREKAHKALDGELGQRLSDELKEVNLIGLGYMENGFRHITNNKHTVLSPDDMKGLKMRVIESKMYLDTFNMLGSNASPLAFGELYSALQQGTFDGMENPLGLIDNMKFYEVQKYLTLSGHVYAPVVTVINKDVMEKMPEDLQQVLREWADKYNKRQRVISYEEELVVVKELEKIMEITELSPEQLQVFKDKVAPIYEQYADTFGEELMKLVQDSRH